MKSITKYTLYVLIALASLNVYKVVGITGSKQYLDSRFDRHPDTAAIAIINRYKHIVDGEMSDIIGYSDVFMKSDRPTYSNNRIRKGQ